MKIRGYEMENKCIKKECTGTIIMVYNKNKNKTVDICDRCGEVYAETK